jgi:glycosyltransferase involved in cell wall biosynthesis
MKKLAVIHFMPIEYYPPATNFLNFIADKNKINTKVWTCENIRDCHNYFNNVIDISRVPFPDIRQSRAIRLIKYWFFNINTLRCLVAYSPHTILYFESYSAWPVYVYKRFINKGTSLYIHYHEYSSHEWYIDGMRLVNYYHNLEKKYLYLKARWISQTNKYRINLFYHDNRVDKYRLNILRNYPPRNWYNKRNIKDEKLTGPLRFVYVGSLSLRTTYIKEICDWIIEQNGDAIFNIYTNNIDTETLKYLSEINSPWIVFHNKGIPYYDLPETLINYDIGLIIYKVTTSNYQFNETNKLFEYLACGLEVWFNAEMAAIRDHICRDFKPRVIEIDFLKLVTYSIAEYYKALNLPTRILDYNCESEYAMIYNHFYEE